MTFSFSPSLSRNELFPNWLLLRLVCVCMSPSLVVVVLYLLWTDHLAVKSLSNPLKRMQIIHQFWENETETPSLLSLDYWQIELCCRRFFVNASSSFFHPTGSTPIVSLILLNSLLWFVASPASLAVCDDDDEILPKAKRSFLSFNSKRENESSTSFSSQDFFFLIAVRI